MKSQFLKDHLIDFEVVAAICIATLLWFEFDVYWVFAILSGLLAFVLISLLLLIAFYIRGHDQDAKVSAAMIMPPHSSAAVASHRRSVEPDPRCAAAAGFRPIPWPSGMLLADPTDILAEGAFDHGPSLHCHLSL